MKRQTGLVVIMALFIVAIVAALSYAMLASFARDTHRTEMLLRDAMLAYYAEGGIAWAKDVLLTNIHKKTPNQRVDRMPFISPITYIDGYRIVTRIDDMQSRYNLNRLTSESKERRDEFVQLLTALGVRLSEQNINQLVNAIRDWLDYNTHPSDLTRYYQTLPVPFRAAHQPMVHHSELRLIKGITPALYTKLAPFITAFPTIETPLNILTASPTVLMTLSPRFNLTSARALQQTLRAVSSSDKTRIEQLDILYNYNVKNDTYVVISDYFLVETSVSVESQRLVIYTLMARKETSARKMGIQIVWQSKGIG